MAFKVERLQNGRKLHKDENSYHWLNHGAHMDCLRLLIYQGMYDLHHDVCRKLWGKPDWSFSGEFLYRCYCFKATLDGKTLDFVLYSDGKTTGKGSGWEFFGALSDAEFVPLICEWLHEKGVKRD